MQKKKLGSYIILIAFAVIICFPWLFWIFLGKFVDSTNYENRTLATRPELTLDNFYTFSEEYESYFNDNFPFRNNLITVNNAIDYFAFKMSSDSRVILGDDDWLFYASVSDGDPISSYQGNDLLSEKELHALAQNCLANAKFLNSQGKEFVIFIAPNKERIYSEYMPEQYGEPADMYRALQIVQYLKENTNIRVVYPYEELMEAKENLSENIWYKADTHWNWIGGYIGACALMKELGIDMPEITSDAITITAGNNVSGDLAGMIKLADLLRGNDIDYTVTGYDDHNVENLVWDFRNLFIYHAENADPRKIYVYRDSFVVYMSPYIGSQFTDSYFRYCGTYSYEDFIQLNPDIFVYETVERYAGDLATFSIQ